MRKPFSFQSWISEHQHLLKPPVGNKMLFPDNAGMVVQVVDPVADYAALMQALANLTGADVAASANNTGPASLGGDWVLEQSTGVIDAPAFAAPDALAQFDALLNVSVSSNSLSGWIAVTPANSQNDGTGDQHLDVLIGAGGRAYVSYGDGQSLAPAVPYVPAVANASQPLLSVPMPLAACTR